MATVRVYSSTEQQRALPGQRQQAVDQTSNGIGEGLQQAGRGLSQFAQATDQYRARVDEATANDLDSQFANEVREVERSFMQAQGKNAVDGANDALKAWNDAAAGIVARTNNPRQAAMLNGVLNRRRQTWQNQYDRHLGQQTEVWHDSSMKGRMATLSVDAADLPIGSEERAQAYLDLGEVLDQYVAFKGGDENLRKQLGIETFSGIHENTIGALLEGGDVPSAQDYLEENREGILPATRNRLANRVREAEYDFIADEAIRGSFVVDADDEVEVEVGGEKQSVRMIQPVSAALGSRFGPRRSPGGVGSSNHKGVDYPVPANTAIQAVLPGVVRVKNDPDGYGSYVVVEHGNGMETRYAHLNAVNVQDGARVEQGQVIALSGGARGAAGAGNSQGAHLHFEVRQGGRAVNPETALGNVAEVMPGSGGRARPPGVPTTPDDVRDWASAEASRRGRSNDWRLIQRLEQAGFAEISRERSMRADREGEAGRELDKYLPGGDSEATGPDGVPPAIWIAAGPSQRRQARNVWEAKQKRLAGETSAAATAQGNDLYIALQDEAATSPEDFMARGDLTQYRDMLSESQYASLRTQRRSIATGGGTAQQALQGMSGVIQSYERDLGIRTGQNATPQDAERSALLRSSLQQSVDGFRARTGEWPDVTQMTGMLRVIVASANTNARGQVRPDGPLFRPGGAIEVPRRERNRIIQELRRGANPILNPTDEQINLAYQQRLLRGQ